MELLNLSSLTSLHPHNLSQLYHRALWFSDENIKAIFYFLFLFSNMILERLAFLKVELSETMPRLQLHLVTQSLVPH